MAPSFCQARRAPACRSRPGRLGRIRIEQHEITSSLVDPRHDGLRIAHLSDLHVATTAPLRRLVRAMELVNDSRPDLVLLTGDYVCISRLALPRLVAVLRRLRIPAWATLGNHDHWAGARAVAAALARAGVRVLANEHEVVQARGAPVQLIGVDDLHSGHADFQAALSGLRPGGTRIALTHDPNAADGFEGHRVALILAGHTHGGQIKLPGVTAGIARRIGVKYLAGLFESEETVLYVNRGLGAALPVRLAAPMEVAFLTLRSA